MIFLTGHEGHESGFRVEPSVELFMSSREHVIGATTFQHRRTAVSLITCCGLAVHDLYIVVVVVSVHMLLNGWAKKYSAVVDTNLKMNSSGNDNRSKLGDDTIYQNGLLIQGALSASLYCQYNSHVDISLQLKVIPPARGC